MEKGKSKVSDQGNPAQRQKLITEYTKTEVKMERESLTCVEGSEAEEDLVKPTETRPTLQDVIVETNILQRTEKADLRFQNIRQK